MKNETKPSREREKNDQEPLLPPIQPVIDYGSVVIKNSRAAIHCLTIAGQIEGHMLLPNTQKATKYEHVLPLLRLAQIILRPARDDLFLIRKVLVQNVPQRQDLRLRLVVDERQHRHAERDLQLRLREQAIQHDLRIGVLFQLDNNAHAIAVGLVAQIGNALEADRKSVV